MPDEICLTMSHVNTVSGRRQPFGTLIVLRHDSKYRLQVCIRLGYQRAEELVSEQALPLPLNLTSPHFCPHA